MRKYKIGYVRSRERVGVVNLSARCANEEDSEKLMKLCMDKKDVRGSTGVIHYENGQIRFTPAGR